MLAKEEKQQKGQISKRKHPGEDGREKKRKRKDGEEGPKAKGGVRKMRLDALSVGYFRRVGERLGDGFGDDEERGEED